MAEYIEREAAIKAIDHEVSLDGLYTNIKAVPAADVRPERHSYYRTLIANTFMGRLDKNREPIFQDRTSYVCAECGRGTIVKDNFCSHCGAKMDGKDGE